MQIFHNPNVFDVVWHRTEVGTKRIYKRNGYEVLILWQDELKNKIRVVSKIEEFARGNESSLGNVTREVDV